MEIEIRTDSLYPIIRHQINTTTKYDNLVDEIIIIASEGYYGAKIWISFYNILEPIYEEILTQNYVGENLICLVPNLVTQYDKVGIRVSALFSDVQIPRKYHKNYIYFLNGLIKDVY